MAVIFLLGAWQPVFGQTTLSPRSEGPRVGMTLDGNVGALGPSFKTYDAPLIGFSGLLANSKSIDDGEWTVMEIFPHSSFIGGDETWLRIRPNATDPVVSDGNDVWLKWSDDGELEDYVPIWVEKYGR